MKNSNLFEVAKIVRYWSVKLPTMAGSGHPTSSASAVELMTVLIFGGYFKYDLNNPKNINNDHLIFSKGHASSLFYSLWHVAGKVTEKELLTYRQFDSKLEGHPTQRFDYTEVATGSLGQGLAVGVGRSMADKLNGLSNKTYVLMGDSELAEGSVWEAVACAGFYKLNNIVSFVDLNGLGQRGETMTGRNLKIVGSRFKSFGWQVVYINNGNDIKQVDKIYKQVFSKKQTLPIVFIAKTIKGFGIKNVAGKNNWHGKPLSEKDWQNLEKILAPKSFKIVASIKKPLQKQLSINKKAYKVNTKNNSEVLPIRFAIGEAMKSVADNKNLIFVDAEVGNSTGLEKVKETAGNRYIQAYIAEQLMTGLASGLSLASKKVIISTFGAFFSRAFDQLRMAAYNQANILCIGTHAGLAIGEDGISQMALEDLALFRSLYGSVVLQPADDVSAKKITETALNFKGISYLRALRHAPKRIYSNKENFKLGELKIINNFNKGETVIIASGATVEQALNAQEQLKQKGINVGVVDVYCIKPLPEKQLKEIFVKAGKVIIVEDHYQAGGLGEAISSIFSVNNTTVKHLFVNVLARSGSQKELYKYANIDAESIIKAIDQ